MKKYLGTKVVKAQLMPIADIEAHLGKKVDLSAHPDCTEGYLVEYPDGYQSFSPKEVFEKSYKLAESFVDRLKIERNELGYKMGKLYDFMQTDTYRNLEDSRKSDLGEQYAIMRAYFIVLNRRIAEACGETPAGVINLSFSQVIEGLRHGRCYRRAGWNGKGLFVCKQNPARLEGMVIENLQNLPASAKKLILEREGTPAIAYTNQMLIIDQDGRADSWVPSSSDIFAEDWEIVF